MMTSPDQPALLVQGLGLQIGGARILEDVGFSVATGEMVGVIGPNGAGKTTLFNLISGVLKPTDGIRQARRRRRHRGVDPPPGARPGWAGPSRPRACSRG